MLRVRFPSIAFSPAAVTGARVGTFDPQLESRAWFDTQALPEGWFVDDLIPQPTGSPYTLTANGGVYSYSGNNATLTYTPIGAYTIAADGGTYSYTGNAANVLFNRRLVADGGTYTYTGNNANTLFGRRLVADGGTYAYSGNAANLLFNRQLIADGGVYSYTGNNANTLFNRQLVADGGVYAYSGNNANLVFSATPIVVIDTHDGDQKRRKKFDDDTEARKRRRAQIQDAYEVLLEGRPEVVAAIAAPFVDAPKTPGIALQPATINWDALLADLEATNRLYEAYVEMDDEEVLLLL
jgi:hypothetical protein